MSGTHTGGLKVRDINLANDKDFYRKIGAKGGAASGTGGFYGNPYAARAAGKKGGHNGLGKTKDRSKQKAKFGKLADLGQPVEFNVVKPRYFIKKPTILDRLKEFFS